MRFHSSVAVLVVLVGLPVLAALYGILSSGGSEPTVLWLNWSTRGFRQIASRTGRSPAMRSQKGHGPSRET